MKRILLVVIGILFCATTFSQTAYENRCSEIFIKYWKIFTQNKPMTPSEESSLKSTATSYWVGKKLITVAVLNYFTATGKDYQPILDQMEKEYATAQKLMTEEEKKAFEVNNESQTPYGKVKWKTAYDFAKWMIKGEFEKTVDYQQRLKDHSVAAYDNLLITNIEEELFKEEWSLEFGQYNADKEWLPIFFSDKTGICRIQHRMVLSPNDAKIIVSHHPQFNRPDYSNGEYYVCSNGSREVSLSFNCENVLIDSVDLVFIPQKFVFKSYFGDAVFDNSVYVGRGIEEVEYKYDDCHLEDFNVNNEYMKGYVFHYSDVYNKVLKNKQQRAEQYNDEIKTAIDRYDEILKLNQSNIHKYTMDSAYYYYVKVMNSHYLSGTGEIPVFSRFIDIDAVTVSSDIESDYNEKIEDVKQAYQRIMFMIEKEQKALRDEYEEAKKKLLSYGSNLATTNLGNSTVKGLLNDYAGVDTGQDIRNSIIRIVNNQRGKSFYPELVDFLIAQNQSLYNEWMKNGSKFNDKTEFYEAYTGKNYKAILKSKQ